MKELKELIRDIACEIGRTLGAKCSIETELVEDELIYNEPAPVTDLLRISRSEFLAEMAKVGIKPIDLETPLDSFMTITSEIELERIAPYLVYPADLYIAEIWDCEDYAIQAQCDAALKFHVSSIRLGLGQMPLGYHGFPVTLSKEGNIWLLDSNAGFPYAGGWFRIGDNGYNPNKIFV